MAHKQHLHQLLKEDQEPFHLQTYIFEKRCQLKPPNSSSQITDNFCKHVRLPPFHQESQNLPAPALLLEAAMRIEKKQCSHKNRAKMKNLGFGILGSVLKKLKDRKNNTRRELGNSVSSQSGEMVEKSYCETSFSCNCYSQNSSISNTLSSFSGHRSPELSSPASSPVFLNKEKSTEGNNNEVGGEHSEQCSPVSVLDTPFEDDNVVGHEEVNGDEFEDNSYDQADDDLECSFAMVQEAKEKLLDKLRRFEKLAELDPVELERRRMEEEEDCNGEDSNNEGMSSGRYGDLDTLMTLEALSLSSFEQSRKFKSDLIEEDNDDKYGVKNKEIIIRRASSRLSSWKKVETNEIDLMVKLDFERELDGRKLNVESTEECHKIVKEIEVVLIRLLMEEVAEELSRL